MICYLLASDLAVCLWGRLEGQLILILLIMAPGSQLGVCERQLISASLTHGFFSLSPSHPLALKVNKIKKKKRPQSASIAMLAVQI